MDMAVEIASYKLVSNPNLSPLLPVLAFGSPCQIEIKSLQRCDKSYIKGHTEYYTNICMHVLWSWKDFET